MGDLQMAHEAGLLSLPDKVLGKIALMTCDRRPGSEPFKDWARAAVTCKRLWALQLDFDRTSRTHEGKAVRFWHDPTVTVHASISKLRRETMIGGSP